MGEEKRLITVIVKVDMHCEGCADKLKTAVKEFDGVQDVQGDSSSNKLTVVGKVDPEKIREWIENKAKKKAVLLSPHRRKLSAMVDRVSPHRRKISAKVDRVSPHRRKISGKVDRVSPHPYKKAGEEKEKKADDKKPKEPVVSPVVFKIGLHCEGCIHKIERIISETKGVEHVAVDPQKDQVTVKGTMDAKTLSEYLKEKLERAVEIVQPEKDDGGKKEEVKDEAGKAEAGKYEYSGGYPPYSGYGYSIEHVHAPQIFSDENPNACN